jgi:hypothetical protein
MCAFIKIMDECIKYLWMIFFPFGHHYEKIMFIVTCLSSCNLVASDIFLLHWTSYNGHSFFIVHVYNT